MPSTKNYSFGPVTNLQSCCPPVAARHDKGGGWSCGVVGGGRHGCRGGVEGMVWGDEDTHTAVVGLEYPDIFEWDDWIISLSVPQFIALPFIVSTDGRYFSYIAYIAFIHSLDFLAIVLLLLLLRFLLLLHHVFLCLFRSLLRPPLRFVRVVFFTPSLDRSGRVFQPIDH